jgi:Core-2/I-Branching enzyme.
MLRSSFAFLERINFSIQKITGVTKRRRNSLPPIKYASNWVSLNDAAVRYLVSQRDFIYRTFRHAFLCDELFVPTVLLNNEKFKDTVYHPEPVHDRPDELQGNLRYIDWWDGSPYTWTDNDWDKVEYGRDLGHLFSRKFDINITSINYSEFIFHFH